jgi:hypothetical protein
VPVGYQRFWTPPPPTESSISIVSF